ncbi:MAG: LysM peptidoglycan-binding domain-containing protein [Planctomycetota bacterium JB042]
MGELEKYGLLSLASVAVLFLVLTFVHRDLESSGLKRIPEGGPAEPLILLEAPPAAAPDEAEVSGPVAHASLAPTRTPDARRAAPSADDPTPPARTPSPPREVAPDRRRGPPSAAAGAAREAARPRPASDEPPVVVVRQGDTLYGIAQRELGAARRWPEIVALNGHLDPERLRVGDRLVLPRAAPAPARAEADEPAPRRATRTLPTPKARTHRVEEGDTLSAIALRYYGDARLWDRILQANRGRISDARRLRIGAVLNLP